MLLRPLGLNYRNNLPVCAQTWFVCTVAACPVVSSGLPLLRGRCRSWLVLCLQWHQRTLTCPPVCSFVFIWRFSWSLQSENMQEWNTTKKRQELFFLDADLQLQYRMTTNTFPRSCPSLDGVFLPCPRSLLVTLPSTRSVWRAECCMGQIIAFSWELPRPAIPQATEPASLKRFSFSPLSMDALLFASLF